MKKSDKVRRHQKRHRWYRRLKQRGRIKWLHEYRQGDLYFGIPRRTMRWRAIIMSRRMIKQG